MPQRSWLAKAASIHDLGPHFYVPKLGEPWNDRRDELSERKAAAHFSRPLPVAEADRPYFGCRMHDSTVLAIERKGSELRVRLDNINAHDYAFRLARVLDLPAVETIYPVDLVLHDVSYVRAAREEARGRLGYVDWERLESPEFLYDWFFEQEGRLQWIAHLYEHPKHRVRRQNDVYLMVDAGRATAEDRCAAAFCEGLRRTRRAALSGRSSGYR